MSEKVEYVERDVVIETLKEVVYNELAGDADNGRANYIIGAIELLVAADAEPVVRGEWKEMRDPYGDLTGWIHEECGRETNFASEYCSKCGAKMTFVERSGSGE